MLISHSHSINTFIWIQTLVLSSSIDFHSIVFHLSMRIHSRNDQTCKYFLWPMIAIPSTYHHDLISLIHRCCYGFLNLNWFTQTILDDSCSMINQYTYHNRHHQESSIPTVNYHSCEYTYENLLIAAISTIYYY